MKLLKNAETGRADLPVYVFTKKEEHELRRNLKEFPEKDVEQFIFQSLWPLCLSVCMYGYPGDNYARPNLEEHKGKLEKPLKQIKKTQKHLAQIAGGEIQPLQKFAISDVMAESAKTFNEKKDPFFESAARAAELARAADAALTELCELFEEPFREKKAGSRGTIHGEFAEKIAEAFAKHFGEPTTSYNDAFPQTLRLAFQAVGIDRGSFDKLASRVIQNRATR